MAPAPDPQVFITAPTKVLTWRDTYAQAQVIYPTPVPPKKIVVINYSLTERRAKWEPIIRTYATQYGVNPDLLVEVAQCESGFNPEARGLAGEIGIPQFKPATFASFAKLFNLPSSDIHNGEDQIRLMAVAFANGKASHWSCWYLVRGLKVPGL